MPKRNDLTEQTSASATPEGSTAETTQGAATETQANTERTAASGPNVAAAYTDLVRAQQQAGLEYQAQCSEAYFDLIDSQQQAHWRANKPVEEARRKLMANCTVPQTKESWEKCQDAYQDLVQAESQLASNKELQDELLNAHSAYLRANIEAAKKAQDRCIRAYWSYLDALKDAWLQVAQPDDIL